MCISAADWIESYILPAVVRVCWSVHPAVKPVGPEWIAIAAAFQPTGAVSLLLNPMGQSVLVTAAPYQPTDPKANQPTTQ